MKLSRYHLEAAFLTAIQSTEKYEREELHYRADSCLLATFRDVKASLDRGEPIEVEGPKPKPCRHSHTWLLCSGLIEWCYQCGAHRKMRHVAPRANTIAPAGRWVRPTGPGGPNPYQKGD